MDDPQHPKDPERDVEDGQNRSESEAPPTLAVPTSLGASMAALEKAFRPPKELGEQLRKAAESVAGSAPKIRAFTPPASPPYIFQPRNIPQLPKLPRAVAPADIAEVTEAVVVQTDAIIALHGAIEGQADRADRRDRWIVGLTAAVALLTVALVALTVVLVQNGG